MIDRGAENFVLNFLIKYWYNAAQKAYDRARERYIQKLVAAGFLHTLVLKRTEIKVKNGMTVFARYEYTPDYCKESGIIEFDLYSDDDFDYINIVSYAENDDYGVYAGRAVRMIRAMYFSERRRRIVTGNLAVVLPGEEKYETFLKDKTVITRACSCQRLRTPNNQTQSAQVQNPC